MYKQYPLQTDKNTQDMPQIKIICIHIVKLISVDFESVFYGFCNILKFCPKNTKKNFHNF